ncbi:MAG: DEAD/DEAH box helicase [Desulfobacterales bacterium]|jgi:superfamily II RNA helicase
MKPYRKHFPRAKQRSRKTTKYRRIKPGADSRLKKIFAAIGVPPSRPFKPDPFQIDALAAIAHSDCLVTAPTGSGKTWIAVQAIARIRKKGGSAWYACPLKALSNAKYTEFSSLFGAQDVGILTGDRKENPEAPVIVGTTEILRNQLYDAMHRGEHLNTDLVVLDEAHFLGDEDRGVVWEEIMIYLPARIPLLLLSATIGNAEQIAAWLSSIRTTKCLVVQENQRPVPLFPLFLHPSGTLLPLTTQPESSKRPRLDKKITKLIKAKRHRKMGTSRNLPPFDDILLVLRKYNLLPAIFFLKSRADCDRAVDLCRRSQQPDESRTQQLRRKLVDFSVHTPHISAHRQRWHLEQLGVGAHHSGQLPSWKLLLEELMTQGLLDAVFATSTVAAGVNFPARTIVFLNSDRFNGKQFLPLTATEFHQMTGRAGRRGMDKIGFALLMPNKFMDIPLILKLIASGPSDVISQIKINFSMVLNLLLSHTPDQIEVLLQKSFASYLLTKADRSRSVSHNHKYLWQNFMRHLNFLKENGYVTSASELSEDGKWASQLRVDQPLLIAESLRQGLFPQTDPDMLAGIIASCVNERETNDRISKKIVVEPLTNAFSKVTKGLRPFARKMVAGKFGVRPLMLRPAMAVHAWSRGQSWETVQNLAELEEGDLAMLILRTADNLRHMRRLKNVFPETAETASLAIDKILREPVVTF